MIKKEAMGSEYDLSIEEFNRSLARAEIAIFSNCRPCNNPHSCFVVAQPGAGKTGLKSYLISQDSEKGIQSSFLELDPDVIGIYHEHYLKIMEEYPGESFLILENFVKPALDDYLRKKAIQLRTNIIQEGTLSNTDTYLSILEFYKNGGTVPIGKIGKNGKRELIDVKGDYDVEIAVLAVDRFESLLSSYEREQLYREQGLPARVVLPKYHDSSYIKLLDTLDEIEKRGLVNTISVYKRGQIETKPERLWISGDRRFNCAREAITFYRSKGRKDVLNNPEQYKKRLVNLLSRAKDPDQIERIKILSEEFEQEIERYNSQEIDK